MEGLNFQVGTAAEIRRIISPTTWKYLKKGYFFTSWFPFHPYKWDEATKAPKVVTGTFRPLVWYLYLLSAIIFYDILLYRCAQVMVLESGSRGEQMYVVFITLLYSISILLQIHAFFKRQEVVNWFRGFRLLTQECEESYLRGVPTVQSLSARCGMLLRITFYSYWANASCIMAVGLVRALSPQMNFPSVMPTEMTHLGLYGTVGTMLFEIAFALSYAEIIMLYSSWSLVFVFTANDLTDATRSLIVYTDGHHNNASKKFLRLFRSLRLITEEYSRVKTAVYIGSHVGLMCLSVICTYGAVRLQGALSVCLGWTGLNLTIILIIFVNMVGGINCSSKKSIKLIRQRPAVLHGAGREAEAKWLQKEARCLRDLRVRAGSVFFYDKTLVITTLHIIWQNTVNFLLLN